MCKVKAGTYDLDLGRGGYIYIIPRQNEYEIFDYEMDLDGSVNYESNSNPYPLPEDAKYIKIRNSNFNVIANLQNFTFNKLPVIISDLDRILIEYSIINYNENMNFNRISINKSKINFDSYVEPTEVLNKDGNTIVVPTDLVERFRATWTNVTIETK